MESLLFPPYDLAVGSGRLRVEVRGERNGRDLLVSILGGTLPHIGAVALGQPRPSLRGDGSQSATVSVLTLLGHKEDDLARWAAHLLAGRLGTNVVVTAGLHIDQGSMEEILQLDTSARELVEQLAAKYEAADQ